MRLKFKLWSWRRCASVVVLGTMLSPAFAVPVMELRADDLLPLAADLKKQLNLTPNQQTLWQQTETRVRNLLRERKARRERLQTTTQAALQAPTVELRDLSPAIDQETSTSASEEKQLREWWLTVNDALDEKQRQLVALQVYEHLLRVQDNGGPGRSERRREDEGGEHRGSGGNGGRRGGAGGMGVGVGAGGASINLPGG